MTTAHIPDGRDRQAAPATNAVLDYLEAALDTPLPSHVEDFARQLIADCIAVTIAGVPTDPGRHAAAFARSREGDPLATIIGDGARVPVELAAFANGMAAHALDYDDDEPRVFVGHPSSPVLSAALPAAEACGSSGQDLLRAFVAGVEVEYRIGLAVNPAHYIDGWHATSTLGVLGAAAACAILFDLDRVQTARALGVAASSASGLKRNFGTMTKSLHVGWAAEAAIRATLMAKSGFTADEAIFDGHLGVLHVFARDGARGLGVFDDLAERFMLIDPGINIKLYPCCSSVHPAVDVVREIVRELPNGARMCAPSIASSRPGRRTCSSTRSRRRHSRRSSACTSAWRPPPCKVAWFSTRSRTRTWPIPTCSTSLVARL
jgi:2-methylcitrate dehydratase PrpD